MRRVTVLCELAGQQDGKKYSVKLDVVLKPVNVDEEAAPVGDILQSEQLTAGQRISDGNYTRLPYQFDRNETRVRVVSGRMYGGWM